MITLLAVGPAAADVFEAAAPRPSVEVVLARDAEDAIEKLARNRRIDAVLIVGAENASEIERAIREEDPAGPPIYVRVGQAKSAGEILDEIVAQLNSEP